MQVCYSPQLGSVSKSSASFRNSGAYTSPGTPDYGDGNNMGAFQKGWCSERVPLSNSSRRHISAAALMPFNSGRTLPSKWDDAERWITSPVSGFGVSKSLAPPTNRRPKAKSGPLGGTGTPVVGYFAGYSPAVPVLEGGSNKNFLAGSPLTTGVIVPDGLAFRQGGGMNGGHTAYGLVQSGNVPGWSELLLEPAYPDSQDEKSDENGVSRIVSRRDMATQMSPLCSPESSPPYMASPVEPGNHHSARLEIRDVQVDKGATMTKHSKRHRRMKINRSPEANDLALTWNATEGAMQVSKLQKEEARITAWENLQNAKAEASIRKLEMKLEKKKSASMDKILNKHRAAQMKAQEMRRNMSESAAGQAPRTSRKFRSLRRHVTDSLTGCFRCHDS
ncbi:terminase small subunit, Remorin [Artemisia annua]|uniref:Terminase small subunit, Remorin n=1 Tax=Artemisia annua TaxID=35608 RepID=A0A2U1KLT9_ARTAN|nr:terminase small subunit, Remorin [Artemisia annua]